MRHLCPGLRELSLADNCHLKCSGSQPHTIVPPAQAHSEQGGGAFSKSQTSPNLTAHPCASSMVGRCGAS